MIETQLKLFSLELHVEPTSVPVEKPRPRVLHVQAAPAIAKELAPPLELLMEEAPSLAAEYGPNADLFWRFRQAKAREKTAREEAESLRPEICALLEDGELVGIEGTGYLTFQHEERITFDWKAAVDAGLFDVDAAGPFLKKQTVQKVVTKNWGEV